jgi:hydroxyethylthiazole kinase-like uncharacterized protein yjeF
VAARHLQQFGYLPTVYYPKPQNSELFLAQVNQVNACGIPIVHQKQNLLDFEIIIDAIFGFSFSGTSIREPFADIIKDLKSLTETRAKDSLTPCLISVDTPSGWHVENGNVLDTFETDMLISLTAPKVCSIYH